MIKRDLAPFIHTEKNAPYIYLTIIAALVPSCCYSVFYYGVKAALMLVICTVAFMASDVICSKMSKRDNNEYFDLSSIISGLVFALLLPPDTPAYLALVGVLFGSVVIKQIFGGAGSNIINPAAGGRLFIEMVFPSGLQGFAEPRANWFGIDSLIDATPAIVTTDYKELSLIELISGNFPGLLGASCAGLAVLGAIFLLLRGNLRLYAPLSYIASLALLHYVLRPEGDMLTFMLSSGVFFVAVFLLGDMTTIPSRFAAGAFAGLVCAVLTIVLLPYVSSGMALLAPVVTVNMMSFVMDYFSKTFSRRTKPSREVDVL